MAAADPSPQELKEAIRARAHALGFDAVGFAPAALDDRDRDRLARALAEGWHGGMEWMAETAERRGDPRSLWPEVRSVIVLGLSYAPADDPLELLEHRDRGVISVYARNRDYHDLIKGRLKQIAQWMHQRFDAGVKVFVDTAPVMEKPLAARSGVGWQGKHTVLVSRRHGSWLFLGEIFTTLDLPADPPERDRCGTCRRCQDICPTGAFPAPYTLDARRCIAYLTNEHHGPIPEEFREAIGNRIYGCDDCLAVCPWNSFAAASREAAFLPREALTAPKLADLARLDDAAFRALFTASPIKRLGRHRFVRNVLIALGNSGDPAMAAVAAERLDDADETVRDAARWAVARLRPSRGIPTESN
ncbi:tRNA epoxyqueuosine(34) reductase QueG [Azospirillum halopraeferens]|uniref:tRNA epoxyqueuosine(34) reductase QueG n=1 Tax=Azospirillum halopraeferens TaxID=34010 RepID=UPI00041F3F3E|nr:tRNA epoxyqueuosine(34) reductase QueG [Azospirillum halopraeferens]